MPRHALLLSLCVVLGGLSVPGRAADEVVLRVSNQGHASIVFPDRTAIEMGPAVLSRAWAYTGAWAALMVEGNGRDLTQAGQTTWLPVCGESGRCVTVFGHLQPDEQDPQLLHFLYRFSAEAPVPLNSAYLEVRLPLKPYAGEELATLGGLKCEPTFSVDPPALGAHLANGTGSGVSAAGAAPHGFRLQTETPHWMCVNDERVWNKRNEFYTIQSCAIVRPEGTTLEPGQSAEVQGTIRFNAPVRIEPSPPPAPPAAPPAMADLQADLSNPWLASWRGAAGQRVLAAHLTLRGGRGGNAMPTVEMTTPSMDPPGVTVTGKLWADEGAGAGFDAWQQTVAKPGELVLQARLTARTKFACGGLAVDTWLPRQFAEGYEAVFVGGPQAHPPTVMLQPGARRVGCAIATGIRLQSGGRRALELRGAAPAIWEIFATDDGYVVSEWLLGYYNEPARVEAGAVTQISLTCQWGPQ